MDNEVLAVKIKNIEENVEEIKKMINDLRDKEIERLQKYAESNSELKYLSERIQKLEDKSSDVGKSVTMWISLGISIIMFIMLMITSLSPKSSDEQSKTKSQSTNSVVVWYEEIEI